MLSLACTQKQNEYLSTDTVSICELCVPPEDSKAETYVHTKPGIFSGGGIFAGADKQTLAALRGPVGSGVCST